MLARFTLAEALPHEQLERRVVEVPEAGRVALEAGGATLGLGALAEDAFHVLGVEDGADVLELVLELHLLLHRELHVRAGLEDLPHVLGVLDGVEPRGPHGLDGRGVARGDGRRPRVAAEGRGVGARREAPGQADERQQHEFAGAAAHLFGCRGGGDADSRLRGRRR